MRYWAFFAAKLLVAGVVLNGVSALMYKLFYPKTTAYRYFRHEPFLHDLPWTLAVFVMWLLALGVLYLVVLDQRYRCRTCLRRLRMPVATGSWSHVLLFGPPRTEYICLYGHGTLKIAELQVSGLERPDWRSHDDMWRELESLEETRK